MDADRQFEAKAKDEAAGAKKQAAPASGATDIFGTFSPEVTMAPLPTSAWETVPADAGRAVAGPATPPVVHEVVFRSDAFAVVQAPMPTAAPVASPIQNGGFTQLLRALNYEQLKPEQLKQEPRPEPAKAEPVVADAVVVQTPPVAADPPAPSANQVPSLAGSSLTELLRAFELAGPVARVEATPVVEASVPAVVPPVTPQVTPSPQVTSFGPAAVQAGVPEAASFTQMFQALGTNVEAKNDEGAAAAPGSVTQTLKVLRVADAPVVSAPPVVAASVPAVDAPAARSFTQMFQTLGADEVNGPVAGTTEIAPVATAPLSATAAGPAVPGSFTQAFRTLDAAAVSVPVKAEPVVSVPAAPPGANSGPGEFTRMFGTVAAEPIAASKLPESGPGSFTQVFRTLDTAVVALKPEPEVSTPSPLPPVAEATGQGEFTRMFSAATIEPVAASKPPESGPGSFTQIFSSLEVQALAQPSHPAPSLSTPSQVSPMQARGGTFTQMFRTLDGAKEEAAPVRQDAGSFTQMFGTAAPEPVRPPVPLTPAAETGSGFRMGGASQVFGTYRPEETPPAASPRPELPTTAARGGLTQLLRTLDSPSQPMGQAAPRAIESPAAQQAGSFTAVYGKLEDSPSAASPVLAPAAMYVPPATVPPVIPQSAAPSEFTRLIHASQLRESVLRGEEAAAGESAPAAAPATGGGLPGMMNAPAMPAMPKAPHLAAPGGGAQPAMPAVPAMPKVKLPEAPKLAAPAGMQQYLPLLLIIVIFLLLALLVAVFFLMKK